jgi:sec-independent protein translocase protein TatA
MGGLGTSELIVIAVVALILFGPSKIPEFARSLGRAVSQFKKGLKDGIDEADSTHDVAKKDDHGPKA